MGIALASTSPTMKLPELCRAVDIALSGHCSTDQLKQLTKSAAELSALCGWAAGVIDPEAHFEEICIQLESKAAALYERSREPAVAELHHTLVELRATVARHDEDLRGESPDETGDRFDTDDD
ncbi:MAG: hypothetical protein ACREUA_07505 [Burkholderiales bacterium]